MTTLSNPTLRGSRFRQSHLHSVMAILGDQSPPVYSRGDQFYNCDRWTLRVFTLHMCNWAKANPGKTPNVRDVRAWVTSANGEAVPKRFICIANTPDNLPYNTAMALVGGGYHEALHTYWSRRETLDPRELEKEILSRWGKMPDWSKCYGMLQEWSNVIEDIRIERNGCRQFPGIQDKMEHLQDFILDMEAKGFAQVRGHNNSKTRHALSVILGVFRDAGLGYATPRQKEAFEGYLKENPLAVAFVLNGPLTPFLQAAMALGFQEDIACLPLAMDVLIALQDASTDPPMEEGDSEDGQGGSGQGGSGSSQGNPGQDSSGRDSSGQGKASQGEEADQDGSSQGGSGQGDCSQGEEASPAGPENPWGKDIRDEGNQTVDSKPNTDADQTGKASPGGGHGFNPNAPAGNDWRDFAAEALKDVAKPSGLLDNNSALSSELQSASKEEIRREGIQSGERVWKPYDPGLDQVKLVEPSYQGKSHDSDQAKTLYASVKEEASFLRARLRQIVRAMEMTDTLHGLPKGQRLSGRFLVDSRLSLHNREFPRRAYQATDERLDTSLAAAVVLDQSGSMRGQLRVATQMLCAITEPLDSLGCAVQVSGFRDGKDGASPPGGFQAYHRYGGIIYDIFKSFEEKLTTVRWRFANTRAEGGTPMADGVQFGLDSLSSRREGHRILFVITDGQPNGGHAEIIKRQIRLAKEAGIHVVGVGIGRDALYVTSVFPDAVHTNTISEMPRMLIQKLNHIIELRVAKRGVPLKSTG